MDQPRQRGPLVPAGEFHRPEQRYRGETIQARGYGFHHLAIAAEDVEAERRKYHGLGYHDAFSTPVPSGGTVYFMGDGPDAPGFVELIPATEGTDEMFTRYWRASVDWDGRDPVRPFG